MEDARLRGTNQLHKSATVWCPMSNAVAELVTLLPIDSRTVAPKPALKFQPLARFGDQCLVTCALQGFTQRLPHHATMTGNVDTILGMQQ